MRIIIDLQGAQTESRFRGIGRYSISLALAMVKNGKDHEFLLLLNSSFPESITEIKKLFAGLIPEERICVFKVPYFPDRYKHAHSWKNSAVELIREYFLQQLNPDIVHITSLFESDICTSTSIGELPTGALTTVIFYDLIPFLNQNKYIPSKQQRDTYFRQINFLKRADHLFSISESSRSEAIDKLGILEKNIKNISSAISNIFVPLNLDKIQIERLHERYGFTRKVVMYAPGGFDARKNIDGVISAYGRLSLELRAHYQLVLVGKVSEEEKLLIDRMRRKAKLNRDEVLITGYVPDNDLIQLYNLAALFVFASKHEGFGLPVLEAMGCGAPVIASNQTSIPEIVGFEKAMFDPFSIQEMTQKIELALVCDEFRKELYENSKTRVNNFSWDKSSIKVIKSIETLYESREINPASKNISYDKFIEKLAEFSNGYDVTDSDLTLCAEAIDFNQEVLKECSIEELSSNNIKDEQ